MTKIVKVTYTYLIEDQDEEGAEEMRRAYAEGRLTDDDIKGTAFSGTVKFEEDK